jgi:hypothetical protein
MQKRTQKRERNKGKDTVTFFASLFHFRPTMSKKRPTEKRPTEKRLTEVDLRSSEEKKQTRKNGRRTLQTPFVLHIASESYWALKQTTERERERERERESRRTAYEVTAERQA